MHKSLSVLAAIVIISACASKVTTGQKVFVTPAGASHLVNCEMLGQVRVNAQIAHMFTVNEMVTEIKNRLRDEAANRYPNADTVSFSDMNVGVFSQPDSEAMGVAFKCFND